MKIDFTLIVMLIHQFSFTDLQYFTSNPTPIPQLGLYLVTASLIETF